MLKYFFFLTLTLCLFGGTAKAQIHIEKTHYTFQALTKTIIPFTAAGEPRVSIEPSPEAGKFAVEALGNGDYQIVFREALPSRAYRITVASGQQQKICSLYVLRDAVREILPNRKAYLGRSIRLETQMQVLSMLPREQFSIESRIDTEAVRREPYTEEWYSNRLSASTKRVTASIMWTYPPTGECVPIFTKEYQPIPMPASIHCADIRLTHSIPKAGSVDILVSGIAIGARLAIDSAAWQVSSKPFPPLAMFMEEKVLSLTTLSYDPVAMWLKLTIDSTVAPFHLSTETATVLHSIHNKSNGTFDVLVRLVGIPAGIGSITGSLEFSANIAVRNPATNSFSEDRDTHCSIAINIPLGENTKTSTLQKAEKSAKARGK
ncbi:MAG: hypothetical protein ACOVSW_11290 [Candidatus Kapaibacteriota bacterium]